VGLLVPWVALKVIYMTSTENTNTATWTRNLENSVALSDDQFGTFRGGRSYFYNVRNAQGRFVRATHVDQVTTDALPMWNAGTFGHANVDCAAAHGTPVQVSRNDADWLCPTCVHVPVLDTAAGKASKDGFATCVCCDDTLPVTKFPTTTQHGVTFRKDVCRSCRDANKVSR